MKKTCKRCKIKKLIEDFYKKPDNKGGYQNTCKNCVSLKDYGKSYQGSITNFNNSKRKSIEFNDGTKLCIDCRIIQNKSNFLIDGSILAAICKQCSSFRRIYKKYKLTKEEYFHILKGQNYCCKICRSKEIFYEKLIVDHCHSTGEVRGLLCSLCNKGLGSFRDNIQFLEEAIEYLRNTKIT